MIVFFSQILYDPFNEDLFHNADYTNEKNIVGEKKSHCKLKIKKGKSAHGTNGKVFRSVHAMHSR